ncbi:Sad1/UNC domain protein [Cladophialophora carrionii]|uniref:Sad1/UNC domain protein n=1 Tax=Cladophialophora carrionii TaxID=86049 RepID=A0A1C1CQC6_9EURO|nr:Sad1/UNC domain protein [Cladophialophora carrionii]
MWFLPLALVVLSFVRHGPVHAATSSRPTTSITPSTSPFRTVNHITHSLPQQCLASSRKANVTSTVAESIGSSKPDLDSTLLAETESPITVPSPTSSATDAALSTSHQPASLAAGPQEPSRSSFQPESPTVQSDTLPSETEEDSPLDDGKFMSFEDWKRENLRKAGQSEHIGKGPGVDSREPRKRPAGLRDSLDSLGDDGEIDLDFSGFVSDGLEPPTQSPARPSQDIRDGSADFEPGRLPKAGVRSKDAGTTCKERFNYASFDCAANVLKWNPEAKSPSAVLGENKDSYMLNECSAQNKFLILELCNDISIDTIVLANFEFFSSTFQTFRVSVSDKYPVKTDKWKTLGTFEARNSREVQAFLIENPVIWARYLRIEFLTHYGNEFYCPVSLVRVHGTTMLEDYKRDLEVLQMEEDDKANEDSIDTSAEDGLVPEAVAEQLLTQADAGETVARTVEANALAVPETFQPQTIPDITTQPSTVETLETAVPTCPAQLVPLFTESKTQSSTLGICNAFEHDAIMSDDPKMQDSIEGSSNAASTSTTGSVASANAEVSPSSIDNVTPVASNTTATTHKSDIAMDSKSYNASSSTPTTSTRTPVSSTQTTQPAPTMQESFFKSVQKRLQMLEANSSLSLQYIEDQSRALRDAFQKVEQRQLAKTTSFLEYLNMTVLNELREFRQQYDQLWQSTVIELDMQRERYQQENVAINARLGVLADEIIFQKRVSFLQLILIVVCLGLVLFSKGNLNSYLELPLVQSVLSRSPSARFLNAASPDTPNQSSPMSRSNATGAVRKRLGILKGHRRFPSEDSTENATSPVDLYTPSTPVSYGDPSSEGEILEDSNILGDPQFDPSLIERPSTSPPVLSGVDSPVSSDFDPNIEEDSIDSVLIGTPTNVMGRNAPILVVEDATPPPKHLKWQLPDS